MADLIIIIPTDIRAGDLVRDKVSGFTGIAEIISLHPNGCIHVSVQAIIKKGDKTMEMPAAHFFDHQSLEVIKKRKVKFTEDHKGGRIDANPTRMKN